MKTVLDYSRIEVAAHIVVKRESTAVILFIKQKVEIATLPSVARDDIAMLEVVAHHPVARDDNFSKERAVRFARPEGERCRL